MSGSPECGQGFWDPIMDSQRQQSVMNSIQTISDRMPNQIFCRLLEATASSFDAKKRRFYACERSVAYVIGRVQSLEAPWGENHYSKIDNVPIQWKSEYFQPTFDELVKMFPVLSGPEFMAIVAFRGEKEIRGYHLGLVLDDTGQKIWSKMGQLRVDICTESFLKPTNGSITYLSAGI